MPDPLRTRLERELLAVFAAHPPGALTPWPASTLSHARFDALARDVLRHQLAHNRPYARYAQRMGFDPTCDVASLASPFDAPPVPTDAFKRVALTTFAPADAVATFRSSGTTERERGRHHFATLELTRAAADAWFRAWFAPDLASQSGPLPPAAPSCGGRMRMFVLMPPFAALPDSSLGFMLDHVRQACGDAHSAHFVDAGRGLDVEALLGALAQAIADAVPVMLLGPSFSYVHLLDARPDLALQLPPGSRLFETGGFKGKSREVARDALHAALVAALGLEPAMLAGEYGMSELSSQLYEPTLRHRLAGWRGPQLRVYRPPPWCAVRVVDPATLQPVPTGELGQIALFDLANLDSVAHVLTGDLGRLVPRSALPHGLEPPSPTPALPDDALGLELRGRAADAAPKGCSLAIDALLGG